MRPTRPPLRPNQRPVDSFLPPSNAAHLTQHGRVSGAARRQSCPGRLGRPKVRRHVGWQVPARHHRPDHPVRPFSPLPLVVEAGCLTTVLPTHPFSRFSSLALILCSLTTARRLHPPARTSTPRLPSTAAVPAPKGPTFQSTRSSSSAQLGRARPSPTARPTSCSRRRPRRGIGPTRPTRARPAAASPATARVSSALSRQRRRLRTLRRPSSPACPTSLTACARSHRAVTRARPRPRPSSR